MRTGGTLVALVLMASCDTGISQNATSSPDVSASQTEGGPGAPEAAGGADAASMEATVTWIPLDEGPADSGPGVAQCVSGSCTWVKKYVDCGSIGCSGGWCHVPFTA